MSPESIVSTGLSEASKKPRCTVVGDAFNSWIFSSARAGRAAERRSALIPRMACDRNICSSVARALASAICHSGLAIRPERGVHKPGFANHCRVGLWIPDSRSRGFRNDGSFFTNLLRAIFVELDIGAPGVVDERQPAAVR